MRRLLSILVLLLTNICVRGESLLPLEEGTVWEYQSTDLITGEPAPKRSLVTVRLGKETFEGKDVLALETFSNEGTVKKEVISVDDNGITCLARMGTDGKLTKLVPPETIVGKPVRVGTRWQQEGEAAGIKMMQHWAIVGEGKVTVPAGQFQAFHLHCEDTALMSVKLDWWFVPGTGMVKEITVVKGPGVFQHLTLELTKITEGIPKVKLLASPSVPPGPSPAVGAQPIPETGSSVVPESIARPNESQPAVTPRQLTVEVSSDPAGGLETEFKSNVRNIYVRWHGHGLSAGANVRVAWVAEDVGDLVEPNFVVDETETVASLPDSSARFTLSRPPDGWAEGKYRVEFYVDDQLVETVRVTIAK